jgi:hypothetical protein
MRALAFLLGARALDVARDAGSGQRPMPDVPLGPLATTEETASAWRRWAQAREASASGADRRPSRARSSSEPRPTPV